MKKKVAQVRAPSGFRWSIKEVSKEYVRVSLVHKGNNQKIGTIRLYKQEDNLWKTHSDLNFRYRNRGFGAKLYARAIQYCLVHGYRISSSGASSEDAQRVWRGKTIRKYFRIKTKHFTYNGQKEIDHKYDTFYAYRK